MTFSIPGEVRSGWRMGSGCQRKWATRQLKLRRGFRMMDRICARGEARTQGGGQGFRWWLVVRLTQLHGDMSFSWTTRTGEEGHQAKDAGERVVTASCRSRVKASWAPRRERMGWWKRAPGIRRPSPWESRDAPWACWCCGGCWTWDHRGQAGPSICNKHREGSGPQMMPSQAGQLTGWHAVQRS